MFPQSLSSIVRVPLLVSLCFQAKPCSQAKPSQAKLLQKTSPTHGSSGFPGEHWPGMNIAQLLLWLKQGTRSLEEYIREYLDVAYCSDLPDCVLRDFFCEGVNQPLKTKLI